MTTVVVDTNVYISALIFGGLPQTILDLIQIRGWSLYVSPHIADEVAGVLARKFDWTPKQLEEFLPPLWERCIAITPSIRLSECGDPDDDRILECAVAAKADYLVTGNIKHFPRQHAGVKILTARQLVDLLG